jgi:hypothetical protein
MRWVISLLPTNIEQIALALDATSISDKFVVLSLNILLAGSGIPIAWCVVKASQRKEVGNPTGKNSFLNCKRQFLATFR